MLVSEDEEETYNLCGVVLWFTRLLRGMLQHSALTSRPNCRWFPGRAELKRQTTGGKKLLFTNQSVQRVYSVAYFARDAANSSA